MKKILLLSLLFIDGLISYSQIFISIEPISIRKKEIEIISYLNQRPIYSATWDRKNPITEIQGTSDSIVIDIAKHVPIALVNFDGFQSNEINITLPELELYNPIDTVYQNITKTRRFSKRESHDFRIFTPNNSSKLDSIPQSIVMKINNNDYKGFLVRKNELLILEADGKRFSMTMAQIWISAIYVFHLQE
jgi:hypothetical protein